MKIFFLGLIVSIIVALFLSFNFKEPEETQTIAIDIKQPPKIEKRANEPPPIQTLVPDFVAENEEVKSLPALDESDQSIEEEFNELISNSELVSNSQPPDLLLFKTFIRNFVVIVDNLTAKILPQKYYFFRPPTGDFMVTKTQEEEIYLDTNNYQRYTAFINLVNMLDIEQLIKIYTYLYPLCQEAYTELGYPDGYFNDRLIEVIGILLLTPDIQTSVKLVQPAVYYKFADPELETLSAGQKLLIRIGPKNAEAVKNKLRYFQDKLIVLTGSG